MAEHSLPDVPDGLLNLLGVKVASADPDRVELLLTITEDHLQPAGLIHGGIHCTMVETAASIGAYLWFNTQQSGSVVGVSNSTDFLRGAGLGTTVSAVATPVHRGRTQQIWLVEISAREGKLIARGQVRLQNMPAA